MPIPSRLTEDTTAGGLITALLMATGASVMMVIAERWPDDIADAGSRVEPPRPERR